MTCCSISEMEKRPHGNTRQKKRRRIEEPAVRTAVFSSAVSADIQSALARTTYEAARIPPGADEDAIRIDADNAVDDSRILLQLTASKIAVFASHNSDDGNLRLLDLMAPLSFPPLAEQNEERLSPGTLAQVDEVLVNEDLLHDGDETLLILENLAQAIVPLDGAPEDLQELSRMPVSERTTLLQRLASVAKHAVFPFSHYELLLQAFHTLEVDAVRAVLAREENWTDVFVAHEHVIQWLFGDDVHHLHLRYSHRVGPSPNALPVKLYATLARMLYLCHERGVQLHMRLLPYLAGDQEALSSYVLSSPASLIVEEILSESLYFWIGVTKLGYTRMQEVIEFLRMTNYVLTSDDLVAIQRHVKYWERDPPRHPARILNKQEPRKGLEELKELLQTL